MWGGTNAGGGGKLNAIISVTYPEGSVCTITNGTKTYTAKDTGGKVLFNVAAGSWTVKCTDGTNTASKDITATASLAVAVELNYRFYIFKSGEGLLVNMASYGSDSGYTDSGQRGWRYPSSHEFMYAYNYNDGDWPAYTELLTVSDYSLVCAECISSVSSDYPDYRSLLELGSVSSGNWSPALSTEIGLSTVKTTTKLDISQYSKGRVCWRQKGARTYIYNLWLE